MLVICKFSCMLDSLRIGKKYAKTETNPREIQTRIMADTKCPPRLAVIKQPYRYDLTATPMQVNLHYLIFE